MDETPTTIKPDRARFMAMILVPVGIGWFLISFNTDAFGSSGGLDLLARAGRYLGVVCLSASIVALNAGIEIARDRITQGRFFLRKSLAFSEIESLTYRSNATSATLLVKGGKVTIAMTAVAFEKPTVIRTRRLLEERAPDAVRDPA